MLLRVIRGGLHGIAKIEVVRFDVQLGIEQLDVPAVLARPEFTPAAAVVLRLL